MNKSGSRSLMPLAKTRPAVSEAFTDLLERAARDPDAAAGLALAYASFEAPVRRAVIETILTDSGARKMDPSAVLASLLGVEADSEVCRDIACALSAGPGNGLGATGRERALVAGDEARGALLYARPLFGPFLEALELQWRQNEGVTRAVFHPLATTEGVERLRASASRGLDYDEIPVARAIDRATAVLWEHRKRCGRLPSALDPFLDLFSVDPRR